ncbi:MAG: NrfD/PsrC family molybdoenzyme membrane anchor subunit, partial [Woeseiaceae bacterium]
SDFSAGGEVRLHGNVHALARLQAGHGDPTVVTTGIAIGVFVVFGIAYLLIHTGYAPISVGGPLLQIIKAVLVLAALLVIAYHGLAMSHSSAIALWSTGLMPVAGIAYALTAGAVVGAALVRSASAAGIPESMPSLHTLSLILIVGTAIVVASILSAALNGSSGAKVSANLLLRGTLTKLFVPLTLVVGLVLPLLILLFVPQTYVTTLIVAAGFVVGYFAFRVLMFKAGVYEPVMDFAPDVAGVRK